jgi:hypothetical protein
MEPTNDGEAWRSNYISTLIKSLYEPIVPTEPAADAPLDFFGCPQRALNVPPLTVEQQKEFDRIGKAQDERVMTGLINALINGPPESDATASKPVQELSDVERLKRHIEELKTQVEQLEEQCAKLESRVSALSDDTVVDAESEHADDEAVDTPAESEEEEEEVVEPPPAAPKRDESLPCEITVAASLLLLVYLFRLFLYVCDLTSCSRNRIMLKDL